MTKLYCCVSVIALTTGCSSAEPHDDGASVRSKTQLEEEIVPVACNDNPDKPEKAFYLERVSRAKLLAERLKTEIEAAQLSSSAELPRLTYVNDRIEALLNDPGSLTYDTRFAGDVVQDKLKLDDFCFDPSGFGEFPGVWD